MEPLKLKWRFCFIPLSDFPRLNLFSLPFMKRARLNIFVFLFFFCNPNFWMRMRRSKIWTNTIKPICLNKNGNSFIFLFIPTFSSFVFFFISFFYFHSFFFFFWIFPLTIFFSIFLFIRSYIFWFIFKFLSFLLILQSFIFSFFISLHFSYFIHFLYSFIYFFFQNSFFLDKHWSSIRFGFNQLKFESK